MGKNAHRQWSFWKLAVVYGVFGEVYVQVLTKECSGSAEVDVIPWLMPRPTTPTLILICVPGPNARLDAIPLIHPTCTMLDQYEDVEKRISVYEARNLSISHV